MKTVAFSVYMCGCVCVCSGTVPKVVNYVCVCVCILNGPQNRHQCWNEACDLSVNIKGFRPEWYISTIRYS